MRAGSYISSNGIGSPRVPGRTVCVASVTDGASARETSRRRTSISASSGISRVWTAPTVPVTRPGAVPEGVGGGPPSATVPFEIEDLVEATDVAVFRDELGVEE